ncbi:hypothetical protein [Siminovitchia fortis]|uniref:hypothetical protein n=1 Tax=Siminovitchia fortis TaxID=254758 RepID=UPI0016433896|nr:hypothetical protein [Siminovitchia fortis]
MIWFFEKDKRREVEGEVEELWMRVLQESHNVKKRVGVVEEEVVVEKDMVEG